MAGDDSNDPLTILMQPPANECPSECAAREARETEAKLRSDAIDEELMKEKERLMRTKNAVKVMLLGNSESGASFSVSSFWKFAQLHFFLAGKAAMVKSKFSSSPSPITHTRR